MLNLKGKPLLMLGLALTLSVPLTVAVAQTGAAPSAKRQGPNDKVMTRDELRACMKQQDGLKTERVAMDKDRAQLDADRAALTKESQDFSAEREATKKAMAEESSSMKATIEKMRAAVDPENEKSVNTFNTTTGSMVDAYNAKAAATQARFDARLKANNEKAEAWNARNAALIEREKSYTGSNDQWKDNCSNRRFREDDEKAIRAGK